MPDEPRGRLEAEGPSSGAGTSAVCLCGNKLPPQTGSWPIPAAPPTQSERDVTHKLRLQAARGTSGNQKESKSMISMHNVSRKVKI